MKYLYAKIMLVLLALVWLLPITWVGFSKEQVPKAGNLLNEFYRIACLFTHRVPRWSVWYFQVWRQGAKQWETVDEAIYARMHPFGHHTRLSLILNRSIRDPKGKEIRQSMATYVAERYQQKTGQDVVAIRIAYVSFAAGDPRLAKPEGRWRRPGTEELPASDKLRVLDSFFVHGGSSPGDRGSISFP